MAIEGIETINSQIDSFIQQNPGFIYIIIGVLIWRLIWYCFAVYRAAEKKQKAWAVVLMICGVLLNDFGLLAMIYLIFNREKKNKPVVKKKKR